MRMLLISLGFSTLLSCSTKPKSYGDLTDSDYQHDSSVVNGDTVYYKTAETDNESQKILELSSADQELLQKYRAFADSLIAANIPGKSIKTYTPEILDKLIDSYNANKLKCSQDDFVNSIGVALGDYLVDKLEMKWAIIDDQYGRDYATIISEYGLNNFPMSSVLKAIEQKRVGSLQTLYLVTLKTKDDLVSKK